MKRPRPITVAQEQSPEGIRLYVLKSNLMMILEEMSQNSRLTKLEAMVARGYKPKIKSVTRFRRDFSVFSAIARDLIKLDFNDKESLHKITNKLIMLKNLFENNSIEYGFYNVAPSEVWPYIASFCVALDISDSKDLVNYDLVSHIRKLINK